MILLYPATGTHGPTVVGGLPFWTLNAATAIDARTHIVCMAAAQTWSWSAAANQIYEWASLDSQTWCWEQATAQDWGCDE